MLAQCALPAFAPPIQAVGCSVVMLIRYVCLGKDMWKKYGSGATSCFHSALRHACRRLQQTMKGRRVHAMHPRRKGIVTYKGMHELTQSTISATCTRAHACKKVRRTPPQRMHTSHRPGDAKWLTDRPGGGQTHNKPLTPRSMQRASRDEIVQGNSSSKKRATRAWPPAFSRATHARQINAPDKRNCLGCVAPTRRQVCMCCAALASGARTPRLRVQAQQLAAAENSASAAEIQQTAAEIRRRYNPVSAERSKLLGACSPSLKGSAASGISSTRRRARRAKRRGSRADALSLRAIIARGGAAPIPGGSAECLCGWFSKIWARTRWGRVRSRQTCALSEDWRAHRGEVCARDKRAMAKCGCGLHWAGLSQHLASQMRLGE